MKQKKHKVRNVANPSWFGESIHYWPPDALALARAMALVETVAVNSKEAGKLVFYIKGYATKLDAERRRDATGRGKQVMLKDGKLLSIEKEIKRLKKKLKFYPARIRECYKLLTNPELA